MRPVRRLLCPDVEPVLAQEEGAQHQGSGQAQVPHRRQGSQRRVRLDTAFIL